ncbi:hypothetical protein KIN20_017661 [Parelaphostrongylus tenuis]|uniref:Uncharacterized protein n=1 Tax=Parelaphostrongylus tenuis TaxID=148309 RepID=A0AAD5N076_PARTN|nr:hypothetical protein KIN20_017661 [Parelaphostrongylus tenuis]
MMGIDHLLNMVSYNIHPDSEESRVAETDGGDRSRTVSRLMMRAPLEQKTLLGGILYTEQSFAVLPTPTARSIVFHDFKEEDETAN